MRGEYVNDRVEPRKAFWNRYQKMIEEGTSIISFYGAGGVGKSALLEKLEKEIKNRDALTNNECKYVKYDFEISTDLREVLKTFKFQLSAYGCEFPLFDTGNYYYSLKVGQDVTPLKAKSMMEKITWLNKLKNNLFKADRIADQTAPMLSTAQKFFEMTDDVLQAVPVTRAITTCFTIADMLLVKLMESTQTLDEDHEEIRFQLNARFQEKSPVPLHNYLPTLFAQDVTDWLKASGNKLVVLLDNYEKLVSATSLATAEQIRQDFWLRGDEGLIFMIPNTLWTIAGRNKLRWDGELADELDQHLIKALSPEDAGQFLLKAGIKDENLRGELVKLTEGYPIFLDLCVDVYVEYKRQNNNNEPTIKEFGSKRQDVVARILRYIIEDKDDAARDMLEFLCMLNIWTDEIAVDIGKKALEKFSRNTYKRIKNFSFIQEERIENEDISLTFYRFDKTIQSIIVKTLDEKFIDDVTVETIDAMANLALKLSDLGRYDEALELQEKVLEIRREAHGEEEEDTVDAMINLAGTLKDLGRYEEALTLNEEALKLSKKILGDKHPNTIDAMTNLANTLNDLGRYDEALTLQEEVLKLSKKILGDEHPKTISAMHNLATTLNDLGCYDEAFELQEDILELSKKILGDEHPDTISAMHNLASTLNDLERYGEALELQEKVLKLRRKLFDDEHPDTIDAMHNLASTLNDLERYGEALKLQEKVLELRKKFFDDEHPDTISAMQNLANTLEYMERYEEALKLREKVLELNKKTLGEEDEDTINAMSNLASTLEALDYYEEALPLREKALELSKKTLGEDDEDTINAMVDLADLFYELERYEDAVNVQQEALELYKKVFGEDDEATLRTMNNLAMILHELNRDEEAQKVIKRAYSISKEVLSSDDELFAEIKDTYKKVFNS